MHIPRDFPVLCALALGLGFLAFGATSMYTEFSIGRPSSTAALGYIFVPIFSIAFAGVGYIGGAIVRKFWAERISTSQQKAVPLWALSAALIAVLCIAAALGSRSVVESEADAMPAVVLDTDIFARELVSNADTAARSSVKLYDFDEAPKVMRWGGNSSQLEVEHDHLRIRDMQSAKIASISTRGLNYVTRIDASALRSGNGRGEMLVIVISGRATGRRSVVAILSSNYELLFEERLERFWDLDDLPLEVRMDTVSNREFAAIGPRCTRSLVIRERTTE